MIVKSVFSILCLSSVFTRISSEHLVVVDAGSSHTSFYLFQGSRAVKSIEQVNECYISGGLADLAYELELIPEYLSNCLDQLYGLLDIEAIRSTPLYVGGTAGLRLLTDEDPEASYQLLEYLRSVFNSTDFVFQPEHVSILTGTEEGIYSLIAINIIGQPSEAMGYGALEMGGASAQIAYKCDEDDSQDCLLYNVLGTTHKLFAQSNLCYGREEAIKRYTVLQMIQDFTSKGYISQSISNPCLSDKTDAQQRFWVDFPSKKSEIFDTPCTALNQDWFEFEDALNDIPDDFSFVHTANFTNTGECRTEVIPLVDFDGCAAIFDKPEENCFQFDRLVPAPELFALASYFWNFAKILELTEETVGLEEALVKIEDVCHSSEVENLNCFDVLYILETLNRGYGFEGDEFEKIRFTEKISGVEASWSLGLAATKF